MTTTARSITVAHNTNHKDVCTECENWTGWTTGLYSSIIHGVSSHILINMTKGTYPCLWPRCTPCFCKGCFIAHNYNPSLMSIPSSSAWHWHGAISVLLLACCPVLPGTWSGWQTACMIIGLCILFHFA